MSPVRMSLDERQIAQLMEALRQVPEAFLAASEDAGKTVRNLVRGRTPFRTGAMKRSWSPLERVSGGFTFGSDRDYAEMLEYGLYRRVGPRTVQAGDGIYSRQAPGGMIRPILDDEVTLRAVAEQIIRIMEEKLNA